VASQTFSPLGLGYAGGEIFVMDFDLFFFEVDDIDVYDATTFAYKRSLAVPIGLGLTGLAGDDAKNRLWAVDNFSNTI
jgi:hypothetical protein